MANPKHKMPKDNNSVSLQVLGVAAAIPPIVTGAVTANTAVLDADSEVIVRAVATQDVYFNIGVAADAAASDGILPAGVVEYFNVRKGERIAALQVSAAGQLHLTQMG